MKSIVKFGNSKTSSEMMCKSIFSILLALRLCGFLSAQSSKCDLAIYNDFIAKGHSFVQNGDYIQAFEYYNSAKDYCPEKGKVIDGLVQGIIAKIAADKQRTEEALAKAEKLVNAFYFYEGRFALAHGETIGPEKRYGRYYYFIDKQGSEIRNLGQWLGAEQFDNRGYAKVRQGSQSKIFSYLLDTTGLATRVAYSWQSIDENVLALDMSNLGLIDLPFQILEHTNLEKLLLNDNLLSQIPDEIGNIKSLLELNLSNNPIEFLPNSLGQLTKLKDFIISCYPDTIHKIDVDLYEETFTIIGPPCGYLDSIPSCIGLLDNLRSLDLSGNAIRYLPSELGKLSNLQKLILRNNAIVSLPDEMKGLKSLITLELSNNEITELTEQIGGLKNLTYLNLDNNELKALPAQIGELKNLTELGLSENQLTALPAQIGGLKNLTYLNLDNNELAALPAQIGELKNLTKLDLSNNQLTELPAQIGELKILTELNLYNNSIPEAEKEKIRQWLPNCKIEF